MNKKCLIIGAGSFSLTSFTKIENDYIIAADGGYAHLKNLGLEPDLVLGDFDSLGYLPSHPNISRHKIEKDDTDMMLAVSFALDKGFGQIYIYGGLGGDRLDHSLANIHCLSYIANKGAQGYLIGEGIVATILRGGTITFSEDCRGYISLLSQTEKCEGISISSLKYELENTSLYSGSTLGMSNEFLGKEASVSLEDGSLLIIWQRKVNSNLDSLGLVE